jgi:deoxyribonuclease V
MPDMAVVEEVVAVTTVTFPYIPGLLSFREAPALLQAFRQVTSQPDLVMFDGQGIAHPQRMGIAAHVGLWLDVPTIGCAKSWLTGRYEVHTLDETAGASIPLMAEDGSSIGAVVRTKTRTKPMFVSPGYQADVETSVSVVLQCCKGYRLPEPTRLAHLLVNRARIAE